MTQRKSDEQNVHNGSFTVYLAADGPSGHEGVKVHASCPKRGSLSIQERFHGIPDGRKVLDENRMFSVRMTERLPSDNMR